MAQAKPKPKAASQPAAAAKKGGGNEADVEIMEFLEGLLEGFRAAAAANAAQGNNGPRQPKWFEQEGNRGGEWGDLNELEKTLPMFSSGVDAYADSRGQGLRPPVARPPAQGTPGRQGSSGGGAIAKDPLSTMMRRHALRSFLEEMCGSVAKAFEQMATMAVKNSLGSQGGIGLPEQRMKYKFGPGDFRKTLTHMQYGEGAGPDWWNALFVSIDVDEDGAISLQDMYDALVLDLPPLPAGQSNAASVFFQGNVEESPGKMAFSPNPREKANAGEQQVAGLFNEECRICGYDLTNDMVVCPQCGTPRVQKGPLR